VVAREPAAIQLRLARRRAAQRGRPLHAGARPRAQRDVAVHAPARRSARRHRADQAGRHFRQCRSAIAGT
jgi:hypothetical protein